MRIGNIARLAAMGCIPLFLSGCSYTSVPKSWWRAWKNPPHKATSRNIAQQQVFVDMQAIVQQHPAWKLADAMQEKTEFDITNINFEQDNAAFNVPDISSLLESRFIAVNRAPTQESSRGNTAKSTFDGSVEAIEMEEPTQTVSASIENRLDTGKSQQLADWNAWEKRVSVLLEEDRNRMGRVLRSELYDTIQRETRGAFTAQDPYLLSEKLQREIIHLRLRMIENLAISPQERQRDVERLNALEEQWRQKLKLQAQETAREQQYWRQTVPQQMREKGEAEIQKTLQALGQRDDKLIHSVVLNQAQTLSFDINAATSYAINQPQINTINAQFGAINIADNRSKSTFVSHQNSKKSTFSAPAISGAFDTNIPSAMRSTKMDEIAEPSVVNREQQLRHIALSETKRAVSQIASRHHWQLIEKPKSQTNQQRDITEYVLQDLGF